MVRCYRMELGSYRLIPGRLSLNPVPLRLQPELPSLIRCTTSLQPLTSRLICRCYRPIERSHRIDLAGVRPKQVSYRLQSLLLILQPLLLGLLGYYFRLKAVSPRMERVLTGPRHLTTRLQSVHHRPKPLTARLNLRSGRL